MKLPRVIFIDGLPGSGKSTTAQRLSLHLRRHGHPARWVFEHETPHPIFEQSAVRACREQQPDADPELFSKALDRYQSLAGQMNEGSAETIILEGSLFQAAVGTQLLLEHPLATIETFFEATLTALKPHAPALIHLRPKDPAAALSQTALKRGTWFPEFVVAHLAATPLGQKEQVTTWAQALSILTRHRNTCDQLFDRFTGPRLAVDPQSEDWDAINLQITQFLGLPPLREPASDPRWARHVGRYRAEDSGDVWEFALTDHGLELVGPPAARLWARPEGGFEIEGLAVEIEFESDGEAPSSGVRCSPRLAQLPLHWHRV